MVCFDCQIFQASLSDLQAFGLRLRSPSMMQVNPASKCTLPVREGALLFWKYLLFNLTVMKSSAGFAAVFWRISGNIFQRLSENGVNRGCACLKTVEIKGFFERGRCCRGTQKVS